MYFQDYIGFMIAILICMIFSAIASGMVKNSFLKHNKTQCRSDFTGYDTATHLLRANGVNDISVGSVKGFLTDHYHPKKSIVNLSESTYASNSVAAVAVAAHEIGHVMQNKDGYWLYRIRTALVPIVSFETHLSMPLVLVGLLLDWFSATADANTGFYIAMTGVILYGGSLLFAIVTLPVELNATHRAQRLLLAEGIITQDELPAAKEVLSAAAFTYLASIMTSIVYFLRFFIRVLTLFGRRDNKR